VNWKSIARVYRLDEAERLRELERRHTNGKIVLRPDGRHDRLPPHLASEPSNKQHP